MTATLDPITIARFWSKVDVRGTNECWPWRGQIDTVTGYGRFQGQRAHRVAYRLVRGEIPLGELLRHLCHAKPCCNPRHLEPGTVRDNAADSVRSGLVLRGERHGSYKLTGEQVTYIRTSGRRGIDLARELGVATSTISEIRSCKWRKHG